MAVSQEDTTLAAYGPFLARFGEGGPRFELVCDLGRAESTAWDRVTAYLIDRRGVVREIFPMTLRARPSWRILLAEAAALEREAKTDGDD